jgi:hypothetical protein
MIGEWEDISMTSYRVGLLIALALMAFTAGSAQADRSQVRHCAVDFAANGAWRWHRVHGEVGG